MVNKKNQKKYWCHHRHQYGLKARVFKPKRDENISSVSINRKLIDAFYYSKNDESEFWKKVAKTVMPSVKNLGINHSLSVDVQKGSNKAHISVTDNNAAVSIKLEDNGIKMTPSVFPQKKLRRVNIETNQHSFYDLSPFVLGKVTCGVGRSYGVIGDEENANYIFSPMPQELFWLKYYQKLSEGFTDETEALDDEEVIDWDDEESIVPDEDNTAVALYQKLMVYAKEALAEFDIEWVSAKPPYTYKQVQKCWDLMAELGKTTSSFKQKNGESDSDAASRLISEANEIITDLIKIASPKFKRGVKVSSFMVKKAKTLDKAIDNIKATSDDWQNRILAMDAVASKPKTVKGKKVEIESPFGNIEVRKATDEEFKHFSDLIASQQPNMTGMLKKVYLLDPKDRKAKYEKALESSENKTEKELFHGSINSNMVSLISSGGPTIKCDAINGRMFGNGSYWSSDFDKSLGYTSYAGSRWSHGSSDTAFMLVGKVHYGNPYMIQNYINGANAEKATKKGNYDCCHATQGVGNLKRDEIITYDEDHSYVEAILEIGTIV